MDSDEELDLMLFAVLLIKKQKRRKRKIWVKEIYKNRKTFGIDGLAREILFNTAGNFLILKKINCFSTHNDSTYDFTCFQNKTSTISKQLFTQKNAHSNFERRHLNKFL